MADSASKVAATMSTVAAIAAALAWGKTAEAAKPGQIPPALMDLIMAMAQNLADIEEAIRGLSISTQGWVPNASGIRSTRVVCPTALQGYNLPDISVPEDMQLLIKGWPANFGLIYVGESLGTAGNINQIWPLLPNENVGYRITNANLIWVSAVLANDSAVCTVEQRRGG